MNPEPETSGVVVAHADLAEALLRAVEEISGTRGGVAAVSNHDCTPADLERRVEDAVGDGPAVIFVDLGSGSCAHVARRIGRRSGDVIVVTGVNLPLLLDYVFHRRTPLVELVERLRKKARAETRIDLLQERGGVE